MTSPAHPNPNDPAFKLAETAYKAVKHGDLDAMDLAFKELKPTTEILTRAYIHALHTQPFNEREGTRLILNTLQYHLAEESAHKLTVLTRWLVFLTIVLIGFGIFDLVMRLRGCG